MLTLLIDSGHCEEWALRITLSHVTMYTDLTVVLVDLDLGAGQPAAQHEGGVVELVAEDEAALLDEGGDVGGVGREAHPHDDCVLLTHKLRNQRLQTVVDVQGACVWREGRVTI